MLKLSLKAKMVSLVFGICLILSVVSALLFSRMVDMMERGRLNNYQNYVGTLSGSIGSQLYERYNDAQIFAEHPSLRTDDRNAIAEALDTFVRIYSIYDFIMFVGVDGSVIGTNRHGPNGEVLNLANVTSRNYASEEWHRRVVQRQYTTDLSRGYDGTYVEDAHVDPITSAVYGQQRLGNSFNASVRNKAGEVIGVLSARADFRWVEREFIQLYRYFSGRGLSSTELTLLNKDGFVLIDYDPSLRGGSIDVVRDFSSVIMRMNLVEAGVDSARQAVSGQGGAMYDMHARKQVTEATGYGPIVHEKFIPSLGWSILVRSSARDVQADLHAAERTFLLMLFILMIISCILGYFFAHSLAKRLTKLSECLAESSNQVASASGQIANSATELSESATQQASSLQETVSSVDEINAMVNKNSDAARRSSEMSNESETASRRGKQTVEEMIVAIDAISESNGEIIRDVEQSNNEISEIVKVIEEIGSRTKVINDIVFQTKLLSFNASVEAARAGEHGKGFAVVAEEVGNLAQMSGNASKEISEMLEESISKVRGIVANTKSKVEKSVTAGRSKIEAGTQTAQECGKVLDEILANVTRVNQMVNEIAVASKEQSQGIQEVTNAMSQLDQVTQQNASVAHQSSAASEQLSTEANNLNDLIGELAAVIGSGSKKDLKVEHNSMVRKPKAKVLHMPTKKSGRNDAEPRMSSQPRQSQKKVVGSENIEIPSANDPRFEDL